MNSENKVATFAAGCFWGVEETFRRVKGVVGTKVGYTGGHTTYPSYHAVCEGETGHAEAIRIEYDPKTVTYDDLLELFWNMHDPTTVNRQGPDIGTQYRSVIFCHTEEQREKALASKNAQDASGKYPRPIVTEVVDAQTFYPAEEYHQRYLEKRGRRFCN